MAVDRRFAIGYISSYGMGGAKLARHDYGEKVENLARLGGYHWMAGNFLKYAGPLTRNDLPVDAHDLMAIFRSDPEAARAAARNHLGNSRERMMRRAAEAKE